MNIKYGYILGTMVPDNILDECSSLYSEHYGVWSDSSPYCPAQRIKLSSARIKTWLMNDKASLYQARDGDTLIGYTIAIILKERNYGHVSWVTQLVVHEQYRNKDVAKTLLFSIWGLTNHYAWGVITANPYAVRALEKATRRRCNPIRISRNKRKLLNIGIEHLSYVDETTVSEVNPNSSKINTKFYADHSSLNDMLKNVTSESVPWLLGNIEEGSEWFAFTFNDQEQLQLTKIEIEKMISASEQVTRHAYSRMILDGNHKWSTYTKTEVDYIFKVCQLDQQAYVLDVGCGIGRHSNELAKRGVYVTGVDYISEFIDKANDISKSNKNVNFINGDFREITFDKKYDAAICLYDVIGSFADDKENIKILRNIVKSLKPGGIALISVMNYELTKHRAKHVFSFEREPNKLLSLASSKIMEKTGNIFDPEYYMVDDDTHVVYRKEQFTQGNDLPIELVVKDKRYTKTEIIKLCEMAGFIINWAKFVGAGKWNSSLSAYNNSAKEILLCCQVQQHMGC